MFIWIDSNENTDTEDILNYFFSERSIQIGTTRIMESYDFSKTDQEDIFQNIRIIYTQVLKEYLKNKEKHRIEPNYYAQIVHNECKKIYNKRNSYKKKLENFKDLQKKLPKNQQDSDYHIMPDNSKKVRSFVLSKDCSSLESAIFIFRAEFNWKHQEIAEYANKKDGNIRIIWYRLLKKMSKKFKEQ